MNFIVTQQLPLSSFFHVQFLMGAKTSMRANLGDGWKVSIQNGDEFMMFRTIGLELMDIVQANVHLVLDLRGIHKRYKAMAVYLLTKCIYPFHKYKTKQDGKKTQTVLFLDTEENVPYIQHLKKQIETTFHVRDMINEPANVFTPAAFCAHAKEMFSRLPVKVRVWKDEELLRHGLRLVHAVGKASKNRPHFLVMEYMPRKAHKTVCLVGKGVCFDAGGLQIKTGKANSYEMKADKTGGCIVTGLVHYFASIKENIRVVGIVPLVENILSADITHPGDIIRSHSGKTVEILDTDAEGRLILADGLSFAQTYKPDYIMDFATLTGWADSLSCETSAIYLAPGKDIWSMIENVGEEIGERVWGMPSWMDLRKYCASAIADLKNHDFTNHGCNSGSGYMAAMFLSHFVPTHLWDKWVHFDITNNVVNHIMNANSMFLAMHLIHRLGQK